MKMILNKKHQIVDVREGDPGNPGEFPIPLKEAKKIMLEKSLSPMRDLNNSAGMPLWKWDSVEGKAVLCVYDESEATS